MRVKLPVGFIADDPGETNGLDGWIVWAGDNCVSLQRVKNNSQIFGYNEETRWLNKQKRRSEYDGEPWMGWQVMRWQISWNGRSRLLHLACISSERWFCIFNFGQIRFPWKIHWHDYVTASCKNKFQLVYCYKVLNNFSCIRLEE